LRQEDLVIYEEQIEKIEGALKRLIKDAQAKCVLLVDKDGHLITRQGFTQSLDTTGKKDHIHITLVGERTILAVIFDDRTTIGMVRLYAKETSEDLETILSSARPEEFASKPESKADHASEFSTSLESRLDDIFSEQS